VGLSVHPRYLDEKRTDVCLGCSLTNLGLQEIVLMVYVTNPKRVAQISRPILKRYPNLNFSIAQSVEPILAPEESYANRNREVFMQQMQKLGENMDLENFTGILVQSYKDYLDMKP